MSVPDYQTLMLPLLHFAGDKTEHSAQEATIVLAEEFALNKEAREYVAMIDSKIILIDGEELAELMIDYNVGVSILTTYEIKRIGSDYFAEE